MTFQKCRLLIFFQMTFFRKNKLETNKEYLQYQTVWIQIRSDVIVQPDLGPNFLRETTSLLSIRLTLMKCVILSRSSLFVRRYMYVFMLTSINGSSIIFQKKNKYIFACSYENGA